MGRWDFAENVTGGELIEILCREFYRNGGSGSEWLAFYTEAVERVERAKMKQESLEKAGYQTLNVTPVYFDFQVTDFKRTTVKMEEMSERSKANG